MFGRLLVKGAALTANLVVVFIMVLTLLGTVISPEVLIFPAYTTLLFPLIILLNVGFVVFWAFARKWHFLISLLILFFAAPQIAVTIPMHFGKTKANETQHGKNIKILTYNTMMSGGLQKHTPESPNQVIQFILDSDADIVCLQEFAVSPKDKYLTKQDILRIFKKYPYKHIWYKQEQDWAKSGVATFSKYPIINKENIAFKSKYNVSTYTDIVIEKDTIRLFNNHLESNRLTERDRDMPIQLKDNFDTDNLSGTTMHLSRKLGTAYKTRARQADQIAALIKKSPHKVMVCGDFNDVPVSYAYTKIKGDLKDAFAETGFGLGWTLNLSIYRFRIDYILYDQHLTPDNYKVSKVRYSDHYPVQCEFYLN